MKKLHKWAAAVIAAALTFSLASCSLSDTKKEDKKSGDSSSVQTEDDSVPVVTLPADNESENEAESAADSGDEEQQASGDYAPAMWKVTSPEGNSIYMMGSMHALKPECYPLPEYIENAYEGADILAVECDITDFSKTASASVKQLEKLYYDEGTLKDHISSDLYSDLESYLSAHGENIEVYESYQLWFISSMLENLAIEDAGLSTGEGIDAHLLNDAHDSGKEIYEVESIDFQMDLLLGFSEETYEILLSGYSAENMEDITAEYLELYNAWRRGDVEYIAESGEDEEQTLREEIPEITDEQIALYKDYSKQLLTDRNIGMADAAKQLMADGKNVFYIVGLAHFAGDDGIIALLEKDGYTCERVDG